MITETLSEFDEAISKIIESDSVIDVKQFKEELDDYGITALEHFEEAYCGCYRDEATFCEDYMSDCYSSEIDALPVWIQTAIDWELVWHQTLKYDYFAVYFDGEYYFFNNCI